MVSFSQLPAAKKDHFRCSINFFGPYIVTALGNAKNPTYPFFFQSKLLFERRRLCVRLSV